MSGVNSGVAVLYAEANNGLTNYFQRGFVMYTGYNVANWNSMLFEKNITFTPFTAVNLDNYGNLGDGEFITKSSKKQAKLQLSALPQVTKYGRQHSQATTADQLIHTIP